MNIDAYNLPTILFAVIFLAFLAFAYWHHYETSGYSSFMTASSVVMVLLLAVFIGYT